MMRIILCFFLFLPIVCSADIFKSVDANGNITYSDRPTTPQATVVNLPTVNTTPAVSQPAVVQSTTPTNTASVTTTTNDNGNKPYTVFEIVSPKNEENIQNQPILSVSFKVVPALQDGDVIQVYVDGGPVGNAMHQTSFDFTIPYRGTRILSATLFDKNMKELRKANSITIYVMQAHIGRPVPTP